MDKIIDFSKEAKIIPNRFLGADKKKTIMYKNEKYLLKFSNLLDKERQPQLLTSYSNNVFSEYIGCKFFSACGIQAQKVILGTFEELSRKNELKKYPVVACKDFTTDDFQLYEFKALENSFLEGSSGGKIPVIENIYSLIESAEGIFSIIPPKRAIEHYWDIFIIDAILGNFDRHAGNWGYLYNEKAQIAKFAPVYDCGSCLFSRASDDAFEKILSNEQEFNKRIFTYPRASLIVNDSRINYYEFISSLSNKDCNEALKRMYKKIDIKNLYQIIDNTPLISDIRKTFYKKVTQKRYSEIIVKSYRKLLKLEPQQNVKSPVL